MKTRSTNTALLTGGGLTVLAVIILLHEKADTSSPASPAHASVRVQAQNQKKASAEKAAVSFAPNENTASTEIYNPMWLEKYGLTPLQMDEDPDHDGLTNREEMMAGSDPLGGAVADHASKPSMADVGPGGAVLQNAGDVYQDMLTKGRNALGPSRERAATLRLQAQTSQIPIRAKSSSGAAMALTGFFHEVRPGRWLRGDRNHRAGWRPLWVAPYRERQLPMAHWREGHRLCL